MKTRCEGQRRHGGAFTLGIPEWKQCENDAVINLRVRQEEVETLPACNTCWEECIERGVIILDVSPLPH